jgi:hypothetical protein
MVKLNLYVLTTLLAVIVQVQKYLKINLVHVAVKRIIKIAA